MTDRNSPALFQPTDESGPESAAEKTESSHQSPAFKTPEKRKARRSVVTTATLSHRTCRWPIGDPAHADFHYCGKSPQSGSPYCATHDQLSYQAVSRRKS